MSDIPRCSDGQIREWVGERSIRLGREYVQDGAVTDSVQRGRKIQAKVQGTAARPYRVSVTFDDHGIAAADCSCPVGDGGRCKHVGAVLLAWRDDPGSFEKTQPVERLLEQRSKPELIALIRLMLKHEPDLESLVTMPLPGTPRGGGDVKPEAYREQALAVLRRAGGEWGWQHDAAGELEAIRELGDQFLEGGDPASAAAAFCGVADALDADDLYADEEGEFIGVLNDCAAGLGRCLVAEKDPKRREPILEAMFQIYLMDLDMGGVGLGDGVPNDIRKLATPDERRLVAVWVRDRLPDADRDWGRQALGAFLLELEEDRLSDDAYLRVCRQTGRLTDLIERLLKLGRDDEAVAAAGDASDYELLQIADLMAAQGRAEAAEALVREHAAKSDDVRLLEWLRKRASDAGDAQRDLDLLLAIYRKQPSLERYAEARTLAQRLEQWEKVRPKLLTGLKRDGGDGAAPLLVEICLLEGDVDQALKLVEPRKRRAGGWPASMWGWGSSLELKVAAAAEAARPEAAIDIYRRCAERQIDLRNRGAYQQACELLAKTQKLYRRLGDGAKWNTYVEGLRQQHKSLRAFMQELTAAGL